MDSFKRSPGYAETQIRLLLSDLKNNSHSVRLKALSRFKDYIEVHQPEVINYFQFYY